MLSKSEYEAFVKWYRGIYGNTAVVPPNDKNIGNLPVYQMFVVQGRPGYPMWTTAEAQAQERAQYAAQPWGAPGLTAEDWSSLYEKYAYTAPTKKEKPTGIGVGTPKIVEINGFYFVKWTDEEGNVTYDPTGIQVPEAGMTEYQKAQQELQQRQLEWQMTEAEAARRQARELSARERQLEWQARLAELTQPSDWIARWTVQHYDIPMAQVGELQERAWTLLEEAQDLTGAERTLKETQSEQAFQRASQIAETARMSMNPPTPEWLPRFAETQRVGTPITKAEVTTPSGQQWTRTPWSVREGLRGYTDWAGGRAYQDILEQMAMMQPRTPVGAGRTQWQPAVQRA